MQSFSVLAKTQNAYDVASHIAQSSPLLKELFNDKTAEGISQYEHIQELLAGIKEFSYGANTLWSTIVRTGAIRNKIAEWIYAGHLPC